MSWNQQDLAANERSRAVNLQKGAAREAKMAQERESNRAAFEASVARIREDPEGYLHLKSSRGDLVSDEGSDPQMVYDVMIPTDFESVLRLVRGGHLRSDGNRRPDETKLTHVNVRRVLYLSRQSLEAANVQLKPSRKQEFDGMSKYDGIEEPDFKFVESKEKFFLPTLLTATILAEVESKGWGAVLAHFP